MVALLSQDINLEGVTYAWKYDSQNGYWKAAAFANGVNNPTESWLVSTEIDLSGATAPSLSFDAAINYLNGNNRADFIEVKISTDYVDNVKSGYLGYAERCMVGRQELDFC